MKKYIHKLKQEKWELGKEMESEEHILKTFHNLRSHTVNRSKSQCCLEFLNSQTRMGNILWVSVPESQFLGLK